MTLNTIASIDDLQAMAVPSAEQTPAASGKWGVVSGKLISGVSQRPRQDTLPTAAQESTKQFRFSQREDIIVSTRSPAGGGSTDRRSSTRQAPDPLSGRSHEGSPAQSRSGSRSGSRAGSRAVSPMDMSNHNNNYYGNNTNTRSERSHRSNGDDGPGEMRNTTSLPMSSPNTDSIEVDAVSALLQRHLTAGSGPGASNKQRTGQGTRISVSGATAAAAASGAISISKSAPGIPPRPIIT